MKSFLKRLDEFGVRRAFSYGVTILCCKVRIFFYRLLFSTMTPEVKNSKLLQPTQFLGRGRISIDSAQLGVWPSPGLLYGSGYIEARGESAIVKIGRSTFINNCFVIIADKSLIDIGERCLIGQNFFVCDSDFHGLEVENRTNGRYECKAVMIGDDVFIGSNVKVLKGVKIGRGAVIGSGSVVVRDVDENCIYAGVPAKKLRSLCEG